MGAKIGSSDREFREIKGSRNQGLNPRDLRFGSKYRGNRGFEKLGFHCINFLHSIPLPKLMTALSLQATEDDNVQTEVFNCEGLTYE